MRVRSKKIRHKWEKGFGNISLSKQSEGYVEGHSLASENLEIIFDNMNDVCLRKSPIHYIKNIKNLGLTVTLETFEIRNVL